MPPPRAVRAPSGFAGGAVPRWSVGGGAAVPVSGPAGGPTEGAGEWSLASLVARRAAADPGGTWVESARDDRVVTWGDLADAASAWERRLDDARVPHGARVGLQVADPLRFATAFIAVLTAGRVVAPVAPDPGPVGLEVHLHSVRPVVRVLARADAPAPSADHGGLDGSWAQLLDGPDRDEPSPVRSRAGGLVLTSSGTTGPPKLVELREDQLLHTARSIVAHHGFGPADRGFNPLTLWHINAEVVGLLASVVAGSQLVLDDRFHRTGFWKLVAERHSTWLNAVPAVLAILSLDTPEHPPAIRFARSASAPLAVRTLEDFQRVTGVPVIETYGMTEAGSQITANPLGGGRPGTVGVPVGTELKVVDTDGSELAAGETGRLQIRGAGVITSYAGNAGNTSIGPDGWLDTGDMGSVDTDGFVRLAGREDDIVNRGGEKFFPAPVEDVLLGDPDVSAAVVVGWPDPVLGEVPAAVVVPRPGVDRDGLADRLRELAAQRLDRARRPVHLQLVGELPTGVNGKVPRRAVVQQLVDLLGEGPLPREQPTVETPGTGR